MNLSLCSSEYKILNQVPVVHLFCRDYFGKRIIVKEWNFKPYCYIKRSDTKLIDREEPLIKQRIRHNVYAEPGGFRVNKLIFHLPGDVRKFRNKYDKVKTYEGDILFPLRFLVDNEIYTGIEYDAITKEIIKPIDMPTRFAKLALDIEVFTEKVVEPKNASEPIIVIGIYDYQERRFIIWHTKQKPIPKDIHFSDYLHNSQLGYITIIQCDSEFKMLNKFIDHLNSISEADIVMTFTHYDFSYIINRMKKLRMDYRKLSPIRIVKMWNDEPKISGIQLFDTQFAYREIMGTRKWETLDSITQRELGFGRIFHKESVYETWKSKDWWKVLARNLIDVELTVLLNEEDGLLDYYDTIRRIAGCNLRDAYFPTRSADIGYLRLNYGKSILQTKSPEKKIPYSGAIVKDLIPGKYSSVAVIDWSGMYSNIIRSFNISYETFDMHGDIIIDDTHRFISKPKGWTPQLVEEILPLLIINKQEISSAIKKKDWKEVKKLKAKRLGLKSILHGRYGAYGFSGDWERKIPAFRLYSPKVAESTTLIGRILEEECLFPICERLGYSVLYGDTDSSFVQLKGKDPVKETKKLLKLISTEAKDFIEKRWNVKSELLDVDIDKIFKTVFLFTKKRYVGDTLEGERITKGIEAIRGDSSELTVKAQETVIDMGLTDKKKKKIILFVRKLLSDFKDCPLTDIAIPIKLSKDRNTYKVFSWQLQAFLAGTQILKLDLREGERFYAVYINPKKIPKPYSGIIIGKILGKKKGAYKLKERKIKLLGFKKIGDVPEGFEIDYETMKEKTIKKKIEDILKLLDISWDEVIEKKKESIKERKLNTFVGEK